MQVRWLKLGDFRHKALST